MCGHCGCQEVDAIGELRDEHAALLEESYLLRRAVATGDRVELAHRLAVLVRHLDSHVTREERGIFAALREQGDFVDEVEALEGEHVDLDGAIALLGPDAPDLEARVGRLLDALAEHIEREDLGIFPVSVVTLGAAGWEHVDRAHAETPTFLQRSTT